MIDKSRRFILIAAGFLTFAAPTESSKALEAAPVLRPQVELAEEIVTFGHLFKNAGALATRPVYRAPDLGKSGRVRAADVLALARNAGLAPESTAYTEITVTRIGLEVGEDRAVQLLTDAIGRRLSLTDTDRLEVSFTKPFVAQTAPLGSVEPIRIASLRYSASTGRFEAEFRVDQGSHEIPLVARGTASEMVEVPVLRRPINRGDIVGKSDIRFRKIPLRRLRAGAVNDAAALVGKAAQRRIRPDTPLSANDFSEPILVKRGERVSVTYRSAGMALTAIGRSLQEGSKGDLINIRNPRSKRVVQAIVTGPSQVTVALLGRTRTARIKKETK